MQRNQNDYMYKISGWFPSSSPLTDSSGRGFQVWSSRERNGHKERT